jgi:Ca-activated chloride channel family protein
MRRSTRPGAATPAWPLWLVPLAVPAALAASSAGPQQPLFSARVDSVRVDVDVRRHDRPVPGLTASDFEVLDNGVPQKVELMASSAAPIDVVIVLDTSRSLDARQRAHLSAAGATLIDALQVGERAALVTFSDRIDIRSLFSSDAPALKALVATPTPTGDTALNDAAHAAMVVGTAATGRPIVILFSDGADTASFLDDRAVLDTARRTGSVVCAVTLGDKEGVLPELADLTGGVFMKESSLARVARRFAEILESFRRRYLVSFTPTGVTGEGWHTLTVRVKGGGQVRARSGYWTGPAASPR